MVDKMECEECDNIDWSYLAGFFDGEGNIHISKTEKSMQIMCRIYSPTDEVLYEIQEILGFGKIYKKRKGRYELNISNKEQVLLFLKGIYPYLVARKEQVFFVLDNYSFKLGENNLSFDLEKFTSFGTKKVEKYISTNNFGVVANNFSDVANNSPQINENFTNKK